jgi:hypothetical protein
MSRGGGSEIIWCMFIVALFLGMVIMAVAEGRFPIKH